MARSARSRAVVSHLLTSAPDAQRDVVWPSDPTIATALASSCAYHGAPLTLMHDHPLIGPVPHGVTEAIRVTSRPGHPHWARWWQTLEWLRARPDAGDVWQVDASDVRLLRPLPDLEPGVIYVGSEQARVGIAWMRINHPHPELQRWLRDNRFRHPLYNIGVLGGTRDTLLEFVTQVTDEHDRLSETGDPGLDMGIPAMLLHERWEGKVATGPGVHTDYKSYQPFHPTALWAHK